MHNHKDLMDSLKLKLDMILDVVPRGSRVLYLDYPVHLNVGDLLIYHGTWQFFKEAEYDVVGSYTLYDGLNHGLLKNLDPEVTIILQGGGSFGDIYPVMQEFRESVVKACPENRIVLLPQSCYFNSQDALLKSAQVFLKHKDFHIYCRDESSLTLASKFSQNVYLCPDMAHRLWEGELINSCRDMYSCEGGGVVYQKRDDGELLENLDYSGKNGSYVFFDWGDVVPGWGEFICRVLTTYARFFGRYIIPTNFNSALWLHISRRIIIEACEKIASSDSFITTRLHGHILALLLSKQHAPLDNNYGKISGYRRLWTADSPLLLNREEI